MSSESVPFVDLRTQYQDLKSEIEPAVLATLASGRYALGPEVEAFEAAFAAFVGARHAVAVSSGTSALHLALLAAGIGPGDEVITVASTFVATVAAIDYAGATARFVDVDADTLSMDARQLDGALTDRTRAVMPVHLHGLPVDMQAVTAFAQRHDLVVIEDAAQAHGATCQGCAAGTIGDMGCFSFYPGKNLGAYGEGGLVVTDDDAFAAAMRCQRDWGQERKYVHRFKGFNYRMDAVQGTILTIKLAHLPTWTAARQRIAERYTRELTGIGLRLPGEPAGRESVYHIYAVRHPHRDELQALLTDRDIGTGIHYPIPVHLQPAYAEFGRGRGSLPVSETAANEILSLPMYPEMTDAQVGQVIDAVGESVMRLALTHGAS
ncbi:MAG: DegT/DnrJ/EryC1/StrS family aminotransferase [Pseudomonadota bacterium]